MANDRWALGSFDTDARRYAIYQYMPDTGGGHLGGGYGMYFSGSSSTAITVGERMSLTVDFTATSQTLKFNGVQVASYLAYGNSGAVTRTAYLFGLHAADANIHSFQCRFGNMRIWQNESLVRDFIPVRFTNELGQSEGAMYDRVSRRLFRNAGTGAFLYGADKIPVETNRYVQDGLIAMWDGKENAGVGLHDPNATSWVDLVAGMVIPFVDSSAYNRTYYWRDYYIEMDGYRTAPVVSTTDAVKQALASDCTIELVADVGLNQGSVSTLFAYDATSAGFLARNSYTSNSGQTSAVFNNNFMWRFARPLFKSYSCGGTSDFYTVHDSVTINGTSGTHYHLNVDGTIHTDTWTANAGNQDSSLSEILCSNRIKAYACRIYSRALTATEIAANYAIDKARFNLP